jgi:hypothetical protein
LPGQCFVICSLCQKRQRVHFGPREGAPTPVQHWRFVQEVRDGEIVTI